MEKSKSLERGDSHFPPRLPLPSLCHSVKRTSPLLFSSGLRFIISCASELVDYLLSRFLMDHRMPFPERLFAICATLSA